MPLDVICPSCGGIFHETNDEDGFLICPFTGKHIPNPRIQKYDPERTTNGAMLRLKARYVRMGWYGFPNDRNVIRDALECPGCGAPYVGLSGKVKTSPGTADVLPFPKQVEPPPPTENESEEGLDEIAPEEIREYRTGRALSQKELGGMLGVGQALVSAYERGERTPPPLIQDKIRELIAKKYEAA